MRVLTSEEVAVLMHDCRIVSDKSLRAEKGERVETGDIHMVGRLADAVPDLLMSHETLRQERDQAIAHDRQPYPTAYAYENVCRVLHEREDQIVSLRAQLSKADELAEAAEETHRLLVTFAAQRFGLSHDDVTIVDRANQEGLGTNEETRAFLGLHNSLDAYLTLRRRGGTE